MTLFEKLMILRAETVKMIPDGACIDPDGMYIPEGVELTEEQYEYCLKMMEDMKDGGDKRPEELLD